jgi:dTDP-glucose pyrophosphorylase
LNPNTPRNRAVLTALIPILSLLLHMMESLDNCTILETSTVRETMERINSGGLSGAVMVRNSEGRLVGLMTDGDLRRMLLNGAAMDAPITPHVNRNFTSVLENTSRAHVLDLIRAQSIEHIPIVNDRMQLVGIHRLGDMISKRPLPNHAVIMAGGKGMRLGELTRDVPKPMLKVAGRPILERIVIHLVGAGIRKIHLAVNYLSHVIENHFEDGRHFGCEIEYLREENPRGSGGALSLLTEILADPILVMNGDLITDFPVQNLLDHHHKGCYAATMALSPYHHKVPFGCVETTGGAITAFREKPLLSELVNAGIYVISPELLPTIPAGFFPITGIFESCLDSGRPIGGYIIEENWADIGMPDELQLARGHF